ncbi:MAG: LCP family protein, partial [Oscillospiraceae bacterium]|nr:LCP family protein [Oscillospiraceae bacterium]
MPQKTDTKPQTQVTLDEQTGEEILIESETPQAHREGVYNILLCGTDDDGFRTDTIIVAHLDTNANEAALLSIPRDSAVMQGEKLLKINSVYNGGGKDGMERLGECLNEMLGFPMDGYVLVNLDAFCEVVDLMGGVWFDVPQDMFYEDPSQDLYIDLKAGRQLLDGENAMGLVRYRKGYNSQDIQRTKVQQQFLLSAAKQMLTLENLANVQKFVEIFAEHVTTDMSIGNLVYFAKEAAECNTDTVQTYTPDGETAIVDGLWYYPLMKKSVLTIVNQSFNPYETDLTE